jgi:hypothetical protein
MHDSENVKDTLQTSEGDNVGRRQTICESKRKPPEHLIIYGRQTWISKAWNNGELSKEDIEAELEEERKGYDTRSDDELRQEFRETEREVACEDFEEQSDLTYEHVLENRIQERLEDVWARQGFSDRIIGGLEMLLANWAGNHENLFPFVCYAHAAIDEYCHWLTCGY